MKYEVEMVASSFCVENFSNLQRHNKLPQRSSSSLSQFLFIYHLISCRQTFTCISLRLLNVTAVFVHLQIIVWVVIKDSGNLFSGQALALGFLTEDSSNKKNDYVEPGHACLLCSLFEHC